MTTTYLMTDVSGNTFLLDLHHISDMHAGKDFLEITKIKDGVAFYNKYFLKNPAEALAEIRPLIDKIEPRKMEFKQNAT